MLTASGNINQPYEVLGMVHSVIVKPQNKVGCNGQGGGLPIQDAYKEVTAALFASAVASGGDGVIHIGYDYRLSSTSVGCNNAKPTFEVYGWGTAIKTRDRS